MKCNQFEIDMADWVKRRLPENQAVLMEQHAANCAACAKEAEMERRLAISWDAVPAPSKTPELWPAVAARLDRPAARPRFSFGIGRLAFASTLAAGAVCAVMFFQVSRPPHATIDQPTASGPTVVTMVAQMRELPEADPEALAPNAHMRRDLMIGGSDRP